MTPIIENECMNDSNGCARFYRVPDLYLSQAGARGRGLFCRSDIAAGEIIEVAPSLLLQPGDLPAIDLTTLYNYYFNGYFLSVDFCLRNGIDDGASVGFLALGALSYCNHSESANAEVIKQEHVSGVTFVLKAILDVSAGTEIVFHYHEVWFDLKD